MNKLEQLGFSDEQQKMLVYLWDRRYTLDTIGISAKIVFDWSKQGLLLDLVKPRGRRKYSIVEFVWFKLIIGLREFGMSLESIRNVRAMLLETIKVTDMMDAIMNEPIEKYTEVIEEEKLLLVRELIEKEIEELTEQDWKDSLEVWNLPEMEYFNTLLSYLVNDGAVNRSEIIFNITCTGETFIEVVGNSLFDVSELAEKAHIKFPLSLLISQFIQHEEMSTPEELVFFNFISEKEMQILELLKNDSLTSLTIRMGENQEIKLIESEEKIDVENAASRLTDYLMRNDYQEIVCKSQNGKVTSLRRTTKHK